MLCSRSSQDAHTGTYPAIVERGILGRVCRIFLPANAGKVFVVTTEDVWRHKVKPCGPAGPATPLFLPGGESQKRLAPVETMAEEMVGRGAIARVLSSHSAAASSMTWPAFLAAIFMAWHSGVADPHHAAGPGGCGHRRKTGVNLVAGRT